jgi:hypothetical protein
MLSASIWSSIKRLSLLSALLLLSTHLSLLSPNRSSRLWLVLPAAQGFSQRPGVDFTETFAPTTKWAALCAVFALAAIEDMEMESINISNAYLNGELKDVKVYMRQPEGFESGKPGEVAHLNKGLYGLRQGG